ncbi:MAG: hybrid sensor histidine kinase/response regulator [Desulfobacterales bacterium]|jgi:signal transduction histidine kinase
MEIKKKILLVDDEQDIRDVLHLPLSDLGYEVIEAEDGDEALRIFLEVQPPIVLTDIKMPNMDGIELLRKIKQENPETEVVMITGHGDMDLAIKSLKYEATDFITKPINVNVLEIALQRVRDRIVTRQQLREYTESLEKLLREKTELQDHLSSLGLMITSISHGIKGLLTGLDGGMYILERGFVEKNQVEITDGWKVVKQMVERIRKMVLDILYYAKERDLRWERIGALSFAEEIAKVVGPKLQSEAIALETSFDSKIGEFEINAGYVHSALLNIIDNAMDACVKDKSKQKHKITLKVRQDKRYIIFDIADNGIGMDSETSTKIFTPFFSLKGEKGTGLGLFISNKIIEEHGGEIIVKSQLGRGSLFRIKIPKLQSESVPASKKASPAEAG